MPTPQPIPMSVAEQDAQTDAAILEVLLDDDAQRPWTEHEVALVLDDRRGAGPIPERCCGKHRGHKCLSM